MISRRITSADIVAVTGLTRHQLRGLLAELPGFDRRAKQARVACEYSVQDLTLLTICCRLQAKFGLKREIVALFVEDLRALLETPPPIGDDLQLLMTVIPRSVEYVTSSSRISEGIVLSLTDVFRCIEHYLAVGSKGQADSQRPLEFASGSRPLDPAPGAKSYV